MPTKLSIFKVQVQSMLETLRRMSKDDRTDNVSIHLAERFNKILSAVKAELPHLADHLPAPISCKGPSQMVGLSDVQHVDLEVYLEELSSLLTLTDQ